MTDRGLYGRAGNAWSTRLGGDHFHPGGEAATAALLTAAGSNMLSCRMTALTRAGSISASVAAIWTGKAAPGRWTPA